MKTSLFTILMIGWAWFSKAQNITKVEYFIDTDPGFGNAVNIPITAGTTVTVALNVPIVTGLPEGFHKIYVRAKNATGQWSIVQKQSFFKMGAMPALPNIAKLEYFIDTDPGFGNATNVSITAGTTATVALNVPIVTGLSEGFHKIYVRAKNATGQWSMVQQQSFFKMGAMPAMPNIVKLEYFIDTDPGFGMATNLPITANSTIDLQNISFSLSNSLLFGSHIFYLRAKDAQGKWSLVAIKDFTNCNIGATLTATPAVASCGSPITINASFQNPNNLNLTWEWFKNGVYMGTTQNNQASLTATTSGVYSVVISTTGNGACNNISSNHLPVTILVNDSVRVSTSASFVNCNTPVVLDVDLGRSNISTSEGVSYTWLRNNVTFATTRSITTSQGGIYRLRINYLGNLSSCNFIESNTITIEDKLPTISLLPLTQLPNIIQVCSGSDIELNIQTDLTGVLSYQWFKDNVLLSGQNGSSIALSNTPGMYRVEVSNSLCSSLSSENYQVSFSGTSLDVPIMSLVSGATSSCSGESATLAVNGCSGVVEWNNGFVGTTQTIIQLNQPTLYQAFCKNTCLKQVASAITMTPLAPTLTSPTIVADDYPLSTIYSIRQTNGISTGFRYDGSSPIATAPLEGGRVYFLNSDSKFNALSKSQQLLFGDGLPPNVPNTTLRDVMVLNSGHFLLTGNTSSGIVGDKTANSFGGQDLWIVAKDLDGVRVFDKAFGGSGDEVGSKTLKLNSGNLLICGTSNSIASGNKTALNRGNKDYWVIKTDAAGNYISDFSYGGSALDSLTNAIVLSNGNIALIGISLSGSSGNKSSAALGNGDVWVVVINESGAIVWENTFGTSLDDRSFSIVEKNAALYFVGNPIHIYKTSLTGTLLGSQEYRFTNRPPVHENHFVFLTKIQLTPSGDLIATANVRATIYSMGFPNPQYGYISIFEIAEDLSVIASTKTNFGTVSSLSDFIAHSYFDADGQFHIVQQNLFVCGTNINTTYEIDDFGVRPICYDMGACNFNVIQGSWHQWVVSKYNFQAVSFTDFCRGKEFFVKAILPVPETARNIDFKWSNNTQGQIIKANPEQRLPLHVAYKVRNQVPCGSSVASFSLLPYGDRLSLAGNNFTDATKKFAYQAVSSSESLNISGNYQSEGTIMLTPGFKITATPTTTFRANIAGCN